MTATADIAAAIAANRFGLGARPGELTLVAKDPRGWLTRQLEGPPPGLAGPGLKPSSEILRQAMELRRDLLKARREMKVDDEDAKLDAAFRLPDLYRPFYLDEAHARFAHAISTERPFLERLTQFWSNHFAVSVDRITVRGLAGAMEREAIRPNVTGRFVELLMAVEQHPAMLLYLDNQASIGPNSKAAGFLERRAKGTGQKADINENLAREILELHTLGVDGGYTQQDVTTFARALTGWSIGGEPQGGRLSKLAGDHGKPGEFHFREALHEPGAKHLLGRVFTQEGVEQGEAILKDLAARPETARHVCRKLARHFVADDPPADLVDRLVHAWQGSEGRLAKVYEALIGSPEAWQAGHAKFKTPADFIHSTYRGLRLPVGDRERSRKDFETLGQRSLSPGSPAGWPDTSADWDGASALLKRIAWADAIGQRMGDQHNARELAPQLLGGTLSEATAQAIARAASGAQALTLLLVSPEFMRR